MPGTTLHKAELYDRYRLPYAADSAPLLLDRIGNVATVADVGAGTGQLTRLFAPHCEQVIAIEPDPAMRTVAASSLVRLPNARLVDGSAEATTLADACIDLLVIGNAYHRFRPAACDELRRILAPGGHIALFSYVLPPDLTTMLFERLADLESLAARTEAAWERLPTQALFGSAPLSTVSCPLEITEDWEEFFGGACSGIEAPETGDDEFPLFEAINREVFDHFSVDDLIHLKYETRITWGVPSTR